jgi:phage-related protein
LLELRDGKNHADTIRLLSSTISTNNDYLAQSAGEVTILAERQATLRTELEANEEATGRLNRTVEGLTRTSQTLTESGVQPLAAANEELAESTDKATESSVKQRDEAAEALAAAAAAAAAADEAIAEINAANAAALGSITDGLEAASAAADAAAEALQRQADAAIAFVFTNIAAIDALIDSVGTFEFDYEELVASIESAVEDARRISDGLTRQTELLADEISGDMNDLAILVDEGVAESDRIRGEILEDIEDHVANTGEEVLEFTENVVDGIEAETNAVLDFLNRNASATNELIDDIVDGTEDIRRGIEETSRAAAEAEFPDYAKFALSTMQLAEETANLTRRKFELGLVTENELIRAFDDYAIAIGMEMDFVGAQSEAYLDLAERLQEVVALKNQLLGLTGEGGDLPTGIATGIQAILDHFADQLGYVSQGLTGFGDVLVSLFDTLSLNVPLLGDLLSGFSINLDEATGAVSLTLDPFTILAEILMTVIDASEAVRAVFERTLEALQPFIDVVGSVIAIALEPFLEAVVDLLSALQPVIVAFVDLLGYALEPITTILTDVFKPLIEALTPLFVALFDALKPLIDVASSLFSAFGSLLTGALKPITWIIQNVLAPVLNGVATVIRGVYNALATVINTAVAILTLGRVRNLVPLIGSGPSAPPGGFPDLREPRPEPPPPTETIPIPVGPPAPVRPPTEPPDEPPGDRGPQPPDDTLIGIPRIPRKPPGTGGGTPGDRYPGGPPGGGGGGFGGNKPVRNPRPPTPTPTPPAPTPPTPTPDRPTVFPDTTPAVFTGTPQGVQFAVATPIVEASIRMLQAANLLAAAVGGGDLTRDSGFDALPPFTASLERLTPLLDRLILEGVEIRMPSTQTIGPRGITKALRPL